MSVISRAGRLLSKVFIYSFIFFPIAILNFSFFCFGRMLIPLYLSQVENHTRKAQLQEVELERTTKQLKKAIAIAGEETAKCKAAKEVNKSLTSQARQLSFFTSIMSFGIICKWHQNKVLISSFILF